MRLWIGLALALLAVGIVAGGVLLDQEAEGASSTGSAPTREPAGTRSVPAGELSPQVWALVCDYGRTLRNAPESERAATAAAWATEHQISLDEVDILYSVASGVNLQRLSRCSGADLP